GLVRARDGTVRRQPAHPAARRVHRRRAAPLAGRRSLAQRPGAFTSTPQATRAPELPVGSVLKSSALACTTRALPSASHTDEGPEPSESCSVVVSKRAVPTDCPDVFVNSATAALSPPDIMLEHPASNNATTTRPAALMRCLLRG